MNNRKGLDRGGREVQNLEILFVIPTVIRGFFPGSFFLIKTVISSLLLSVVTPLCRIFFHSGAVGTLGL